MLRTTAVRQSQMLNASTMSSKARPKSRARLPVPPLRQTLDRYLLSLEPFLLEDEAHGGMSYSSAYALREKWANDFESGIGKVLQERLVALDRVSSHNWLDDNFWINKAYLEWRAPLLVNSNWWLAFCDDPLIPKSALSGETNNNRAGTTFWQLRRSAWLIHRMLEFKDNVTHSQDNTTSGQWLYENVSKLFNLGRIPEPYCDTLSTIPDRKTRAARSIHVMLHNWCYSVVVYHPPSSTSPDAPLKLYSPAEIEARLRAVVLDVESRLANGENALPVGVLSADERDRWAKNLSYLQSLSPENRKTHLAILQSVMGLSLEHMSYVIPPVSSSPATTSSTAQSTTSSTSSLPPSDSSDPSSPPFNPHTHTRDLAQTKLDSHLHTIRGTPQNVSNRFFDKSFTLIVDPSTRAGATGEHSPVDALVPSIVAEYGVVQGVDVQAFNKPSSSSPSSSAPSSEVTTTDGQGWERLDWVADEKIWKECKAAQARATEIMNDSDASVLWFQGFGTDWIKNIGGLKLSPDAFIQMALQLAWYRHRGEFTATYETVLTRMFKRGRTETLRVFSRESRLWVLSMADPKASTLQRMDLLRQAVNSHSRRTREAMTGRGFDRHLLGLRLLLRPLNNEVAPLLDDELFERSSRWKLSTSGLSAGLLFKGTGFGAAYPDGYGINYLAAPNMIKFGIESKFADPSTSTQAFKAQIVLALQEMKALCEATFDRLEERLHHL